MYHQDLISIAIVHWQNKKLLNNLLSILNDDNNRFEIIVVDNGTDKPLSDLKKRFNKVKWIENNYNRGFSFACNQATAVSSKDWIFFLNPDVEIRADEIANLFDYAQSRSWIAISPKSDSTKYNKPLPTFFSLIQEFSPLRKIVPDWIFRDKTLMGGALLIRKDILMKVGGWDERFFLWFEDSDLTQKLNDLKYKYGWSDFSIKHLGGRSIQKIEKSLQIDIFFHSMMQYSKKYFSRISQFLLKIVKNKYSSSSLLPTLNPETTCITIPNLKHQLLNSFLEENYHLFDFKLVELIIVTSKLSQEKFWGLKKKYPMIRIVNLEQNNGFAHTVNTGFRVSTGLWLGTFNDDLQINEKLIPALIKNKNYASINPLIKNEKGLVESNGIKIHQKGKAEGNLSSDISSLHETQATNGACALYQKNALDKVGIFDERFESYLEDVDLSIRLNKAGCINGVNPTATAIHKKHSSSKFHSVQKSWNDVKNWWLLILKHPKYFGLWSNLLPVFVERLRNFSGFLKSVLTHPQSLIKPLVIFIIMCLFVWLRLYHIETSLLFFNDIGRDFLTLLRWEQTAKPPLLGPQTSALPYNQSALYFYLLYPLFLLTGHSAFSTIYTNVIFYITFFILGLYALRNHRLLQKSLLITSLLIAIHPQFIHQQRFVWNPSFVAPLVIVGTYGLILLNKRSTLSRLWGISLSLALSTAFSYSAIPILIAVMIMIVFIFPKKILQTIFAFSCSVFLVNAPTVFFELRHQFVLTKLLFYGEKLPQNSISVLDKFRDLLRFSLLQPTQINYLTIFLLGLLTIFIIWNSKQITKLTPLMLASSLFLINLLILLITPISIQAHYVFGFLTLLIILISFLPKKISFTIVGISMLVYFNPSYLTQYFSPAYRSVEQTNQCAIKICELEKEPFFVSVQSDLHPYHNGMEFKYLFAENGCDVKELDTQISEASLMAVVVDHSNYQQGRTQYNELTQFGDSSVINTYSCQENLTVVMLRRNEL